MLFLINNMYVNPQLANCIHTRSLSASNCRNSDQTLVCTGGRQVVNTYIFKLRQFVLIINNQIRTCISLLVCKTNTCILCLISLNVLLNYFILGRFHSYISNVYIVRNLYILIIQNMHFLHRI